jgi:beta-1,2-mannobiose phosphorylase / 1,2-beta-oligomannan phosphorylase
MERFSGNPILQPIAEQPWESRGVFNAGALYYKEKIHIFYRALGNDNISRIGYATSQDGFHIDERLPDPIFEPKVDAETMGVEDPRVVKFDDQLLMAYTAVKEYGHRQVHQVSLTSLALSDFEQRNWNWGPRRLPFPGIRNKDAVIFPKKVNGRYVMLHRIEPDLCIAYSDDLINWCNVRCIMKPRIEGWDDLKIGAAGTPFELNEGWLMLYHGVNMDNVYHLGLILLDKNNPEQILYRSKDPILSPQADYERFGKVPNVVFSCGDAIMDNHLYVYYGGADSSLNVATIPFDKLLASINF